MSAVTEGDKPYYFVPAPSRHPASVAFGMLLIIFGAS
jgi:cytochrome c oxidase subunit 3